MLGIPELQKAVKYARSTGYVLHDLRNPDTYSVDNSAEIKKLDAAFMDAANSLNMDFVSFAGYGESPIAMKLSDQMADKILDISSQSDVAMRNMDVYAFSVPLFKSSMKKWLKTVSIEDMRKLKEYWENV